jgi:hypothetical protein
VGYWHFHHHPRLRNPQQKIAAKKEREKFQNKLSISRRKFPELGLAEYGGMDPVIKPRALPTAMLVHEIIS